MKRCCLALAALLMVPCSVWAEDEPSSAAVVETSEAPTSAPASGPVVEPTTGLDKPAPASEPAPEMAGPGAIFEYANTWDVNIEGGLGSTFSPGRLNGFGRVRGGVLLIRDNIHAMAGATIEISNLTPLTFGLQAEILHLEWGLWAQAGALLDTKPRPGFMAAVGYSVFGFEMQYRDFGPQNGAGPYQFAIFGKLRIPVRHIVKVFTGK